MKKLVKILSLLIVTVACTGCATMGNLLNPFYETPPPNAFLGEKNDKALTGNTGGRGDEARKALEHVSEYRRESSPQPYNPVMNPAVVRLMWIPDHLNANGDLVPAHYYYLKVLNESWNLQDAFDIEAQVKGGSRTATDGMPYVTGDEASKFGTAISGSNTTP